MPHLVEFLSCSDRSDIWYEAAWALTNVTSGISQQTRAVKAAAVAPFIHLLSSKLLIIAEPAVFALGTIADDGPDLRDQH